jgi:hypothetical protein
MNVYEVCDQVVTFIACSSETRNRLGVEHNMLSEIYSQFTKSSIPQTCKKLEPC